MKVSPARERQLKLAANFRKSAQSLQGQAAAKRDPAVSHQNITARRARIAAGMSADADYLEKIQVIMAGMAADIEARQLPRALRGVTTRSMVERLLGNRYYPPVFHISTLRDVLKATSRVKEVAAARRSIKRLYSKMGAEESFLRLTRIPVAEAMIALVRVAEGKPDVFLNGTLPSLLTSLRMMKAGITSEERWLVAHEAALDYTKRLPDRAQEKKLRDLEYNLIGAKIPGFFPTPRNLAERMAQAAGIREGMTVLEPSAGKGDIGEVLRTMYPGNPLTCVELSYNLAEVLRIKNFPWVLQEDFLEHSGKYDRIVMNPPFENGQDIDHVMHAYKCLKPGGRVVALMSEGPFFREQKKDVEFRAWLKRRRGDTEKIEDAFVGAQAFRQTGVNIRLVVIDKVV